jgi:hypothetical protein
MVSSKDRTREQFSAWFNQALDDAGVIRGRGRPQEVAKRYKVSVPAARKWLTGQATPDSARLISIVEDLGQSESAGLIGRTAASLGGLSVEERPQHRSAIVAAGENLDGYVRLPLLSMEAGMGIGTEIDELPSVVQYVDVAEWWANSNLPKPASRVKIITGRGDSNAPLINHGDIVFVDTMNTAFDGDGLYVFNWHGKALIKRLVPNIRTGKLQIVSANPAYPPEDIEISEIDGLHLAGRVVAWYTLRSY